MSLPGSAVVRQEVELIMTRARLLQVENQLAQEQARSRGESSLALPMQLSTEDRERLDKLEVERCHLLEEMGSLKTQLALVQEEAADSKRDLTETRAAAASQAKELRVQLDHTQCHLAQSQEECSQLRTELNATQLEHTTRFIEDLEDLRQQHSRTVDSLQSRLKDAESANPKLRVAQERVRELEGVVHRLREGGHLVEFCQERLSQFDQLERQCRALRQENETLSTMRDNQHLLRYKLSVLEERCEHVQKLEEDVARLSLENKGLKDRLSQNDSPTEAPSLTLMEYRLSQLQSREKILVVELGELRSELSLAKSSTEVSNQELSLLKEHMIKAQEELKTKDEKIRKLEKRLIFLAKEREGCLNVLKSYTVDAGSDGVLRAALIELEEQLAIANRRADQI